MHKATKFFVTGGSGFIGSHLVDRLVNMGEVTVYDNLSSGKREFIEHHFMRDNFHFVKADLLDFETLKKSMVDHDSVFHLAANTNIRAGTKKLDLDLQNGIISFMLVKPISSLAFFIALHSRPNASL